MNSSRNELISAQIDASAPIIKKQISQYQAEADAVLRKSRCKARLFGLLTRSSRLLFRQSLHIEHLPAVEASDPLRLENIYPQLQTAISSIVGDKRFARHIEDSEQAFGLYELILAKVVEKQLRMVACLELLESLADSGLLFLLFLVAQSWLAANPRDPGFAYLLPAVLAVRFCSVWLSQKKRQLTDEAQLLRQQTLRVLIYDKLAVSDSYFLEHCDNNLISKAFHEDLAELSQANRHVGSALSLGAYFALLLLVGVWQRLLLAFAVVALLAACVLALAVFLRRLDLRLSENVLDQKRVIYELLYNFKAIRTKDLSQLSSVKLQKLRRDKHAILKKSFVLAACVSAAGRLVPLLGVALPYAWYLLRSGSAGLFQVAETREEGRPVRYLRENYLMAMFLLMHAALHAKTLARVTEDLQACERYKKSVEFYDRFFNNKSIFESSLDSSAGPPGSIKLVDCEVFERDKATVSELITEMMNPVEAQRVQLPAKKPEADSGQPLDRKSTVKEILMSKVLSPNKRSQRDRSVHRKKSSVPDRLKLLFLNMSLELKPGDRLCILQPRQNFKLDKIFEINNDCIKGLIRFILGDCILSDGRATIAGKISYFNPHVETFLVGKTIRDNIIFGHPFILDRYEKVLQMLQVNFYQYFGRDFYQVTEQANNVKSEDKRQILLARFLYSNSDIYIIEDYLTEDSPLLNYALIEEALFRHLKGKTVVYNSNILDYIKMSTLTLKFKSAHSYSVRQTAVFLERIKANPTDKFQRLASVKPKHATSRTFKNSLFIQTAGFEEELIIHKKLEKQKKETEQLAREEKNVLLRLFHGIVLTARRLQEGRNFSDSSLKGEQASLKVFWAFLYRNYRALLFLTLATCLLGELAIALTEYLVFVSFSSSDGLIPEQLIHRKAIFVASFTSVCLLAQTGFHLLLVRLCLRASEKLYLDTLTLLMNCDASFVQQNYIHTILHRASSDTHQLERGVLRDLLAASQGLSSALASAYVILHVFSFLIPLAVLGLLLAVQAFALAQLYPSYRRLAGLASLFEQKTQVLSYQLLAIIPSLRRNKLMQVIDKRFFALNSNSLAVARCVWATHRAALDRLEWLLLFLGASLLLAVALFVGSRSSLNWLQVGKQSAAWGLLHVYRLLSRSCGVYWKLVRLDERLAVYARIFDLNEELKKKQKSSNKLTWSKVEFNQLRPIVFKNVSLTLGYQPVLKKVSFSIVPNSRVGIFGIDGFGRKAIFEILTGFKKPDAGKAKVSVFGVDVEDLTAELLGRIFMVEKEPNLLEGTIYQNIDPYSKMRPEQVAEILHRFRVDMCSKDQRANILEIKRSYKASKKQTSLPEDLTLGLAENRRDLAQAQPATNAPDSKAPSAQSHSHQKLNLHFTTDINQKRNGYLQIKNQKLSSDEVVSPIKAELQKHKMKHPQQFSSRLIQEDREVEEAILSLQLKNRTSLEKAQAMKSLASNADDSSPSSPAHRRVLHQKSLRSASRREGDCPNPSDRSEQQPLFTPHLSNKLSIVPLEVPSAKSGDAGHLDRSDPSEEAKAQSAKSQGSGSPYNSFYFERSSLSSITKSPKHSKKLLRISSEAAPNALGSAGKRTPPSHRLAPAALFGEPQRRPCGRLRRRGFLRDEDQLQRLERLVRGAQALHHLPRGGLQARPPAALRREPRLRPRPRREPAPARPAAALLHHHLHHQNKQPRLRVHRHHPHGRRHRRRPRTGAQAPQKL